MNHKGSYVEFTAKAPKYRRWPPLFASFLKTDRRASEAVGLGREDIGFEGNPIPRFSVAACATPSRRNAAEMEPPD